MEATAIPSQIWWDGQRTPSILPFLSKATPESKGARPCRHCGSGKHWDNECKHSRQGERWIHANLAFHNDEDKSNAQAEYDKLYYASDSDEGSHNSSQDFCEPLQSDERQNHQDNPILKTSTYISKLEGTQDSSESLENGNTQVMDNAVTDVRSNKVYGSPCQQQVGDLETVEKPESLAKDLTHINRGALNRRSHRRLAREIDKPQFTISNLINSDQLLVVMKKHSSRPPRCSFLGSKAIQVNATINSISDNPVSVIIDSGSDITLISRKFLEDYIRDVKIKQGQ